MQLSRVVDPHGKETHFWRSAQSGGRATIQKRKGINNVAQAGDVVCITQHPKALEFSKQFYIECKHVKDLNIDTSVLKGRGLLKQFWAKACVEARESGKLPMLIARQNIFGTLLILNNHGETALRLMGYLEYLPMLSTRMMQRGRNGHVFFFWFSAICGGKEFKS